MLTRLTFPVRIAGRWASGKLGRPNFSAKYLHLDKNLKRRLEVWVMEEEGQDG